MEELLNYLNQNFDEQKVAEMLDEEIINWVDADWEEDYESEYDWYIDHNNNEAEDEIINLDAIRIEEDKRNMNQVSEVKKDLEKAISPFDLGTNQ